MEKDEAAGARPWDRDSRRDQARGVRRRRRPSIRAITSRVAPLPVRETVRLFCAFQKQSDHQFRVACARANSPLKTAKLGARAERKGKKEDAPGGGAASNTPTDGKRKKRPTAEAAATAGGTETTRAAERHSTVAKIRSTSGSGKSQSIAAGRRRDDGRSAASPGKSVGEGTMNAMPRRLRGTCGARERHETGRPGPTRTKPIEAGGQRAKPRCSGAGSQRSGTTSPRHGDEWGASFNETRPGAFRQT